VKSKATELTTNPSEPTEDTHSTIGPIDYETKEDYHRSKHREAAGKGREKKGAKKQNPKKRKLTELERQRSRRANI
jgi:hypothetical protein